MYYRVKKLTLKYEDRRTDRKERKGKCKADDGE
jgi:hypothetical protein